ncbi:Phosphatidylserine decarboxylase proenzyme 2, mitochondrial [Zancudomyces culisetae]|uniref:Phosphatidylserine decarboxylase proenzyme 1, mitochondrial n=1 Tax=Zancudomyces culisetae TaxID=1213189 RepID=A0A1R1PSV9_ZANCU|nr:Phosphatidylserine decarboxylase proenzyme 2, mitochondrial [Zancudomyces culisetae]|eukprot:OMH84048.1 Phosphatidylserine decarboxylase proenzyme 2, mitochondrial [Zancudomyces culisetae]
MLPKKKIYSSLSARYGPSTLQLPRNTIPIVRYSSIHSANTAGKINIYSLRSHSIMVQPKPHDNGNGNSPTQNWNSQTSLTSNSNSSSSSIHLFRYGGISHGITFSNSAVSKSVTNNPTKKSNFIPSRNFLTTLDLTRFKTRRNNDLGIGSSLSIRKNHFSSSSSAPNGDENKGSKKDEKSQKLEWFWIPAKVGIAYLCVLQLYHLLQKTYNEKSQLEDQDGEHDHERQQHQGHLQGHESEGDHEKIARVVQGPWHVKVVAKLPLRALSRFFGWFNELELPVVLRSPLLRLYGWVFGCDMSEMKDPDLKNYSNLASFFYREIKETARPIDSGLVVSPSDGKVLHFGVVESDGVIEQVKGVTYSLRDFLGMDRRRKVPSDGSHNNINTITVVNGKSNNSKDDGNINSNGDSNGNGDGKGSDAETKTNTEVVVSTNSSNGDAHVNESDLEVAIESHSEALSSAENFAEINDISYSVDTLLLGGKNTISASDDSTSGSVAHIQDIKLLPGNKLFFCVVYLAPGNYHRFHSPTDWTVQSRRHFVGDLYSVSPYIAKKLRNLFVLNERVCLMGTWKHGFMSMVPVGATNVGSVVLNFEDQLKTNLKHHPKSMFGRYFELIYGDHSGHSAGGIPITKGQELGGFRLGSTVVLVFEAPETFKFCINPGQKIEMGQLIGDLSD